MRLTLIPCSCMRSFWVASGSSGSITPQLALAGSRCGSKGPPRGAAAAAGAAVVAAGGLLVLVRGVEVVVVEGEPLVLLGRAAAPRGGRNGLIWLPLPLPLPLPPAALPLLLDPLAVGAAVPLLLVVDAAAPRRPAAAAGGAPISAETASVAATVAASAAAVVGALPGRLGSAGPSPLGFLPPVDPFAEATGLVVVEDIEVGCDCAVLLTLDAWTAVAELHRWYMLIPLFKPFVIQMRKLRLLQVCAVPLRSCFELEGAVAALLRGVSNQRPSGRHYTVGRCFFV